MWVRPSAMWPISAPGNYQIAKSPLIKRAFLWGGSKPALCTANRYLNLGDTMSKLLGDAGEHYALSQFSFAGKYAAKMPDNWKAYDLAVEPGAGLVRVSVKTRSESVGWRNSRWFTFDDRQDCDWMVFIFKPREGPLRSWVMPYAVVKSNANVPGPNRKDAWSRDVSWVKLNRLPLSSFEGNWSLKPNP